MKKERSKISRSDVCFERRDGTLGAWRVKGEGFGLRDR